MKISLYYFEHEGTKTERHEEDFSFCLRAFMSSCSKYNILKNSTS